MTTRIQCKRVHEPPADADGTRVLVDRLWPRGLAREKAAFDHWLKDVAPSTGLRKWFGHREERWSEFIERYRYELEERCEPFDELLRRCRSGPVTLLYAARDTEHNHAVVLADALEQALADENAALNEPSSPVCYATDSDH